MKKILRRSALGAVLLAFFLFSCGGEGTSSADNSSGSSEATSENPASVHADPSVFTASDKTVTSTQVVTYPGPSLMETSDTIGVTVNGTDLFVYETRVNHNRVFSWNVSEDTTTFVNFSFEGKIHIEVTVKDESVTVSSALVRPLVYGIVPTISGNTISFDLDKTGTYVVEYNDDSTTAVQIFANPLEEDPITEEEAAADSNITYVGPGIYNAGAFPIHDGSIIYLAGGAYVYGQFSSEGTSNVTIRGRGIVSGSIYSRSSSSDYTIPVVMRNVTGLTIEGITFIDPAGWTIHLWKCESCKKFV